MRLGCMEILVTDKEVDMMKIKQLANEWHETLVKGVADCKQGLLALGGEWHMDANNKLLESGSSQENLWGFNIYPQKSGSNALEYISLVNIRPSQGNTDMELKDEVLRGKIKKLVKKIIPDLNL
jgi:hypothetical protein